MAEKKSRLGNNPLAWIKDTRETADPAGSPAVKAVKDATTTRGTNEINNTGFAKTTGVKKDTVSSKGSAHGKSRIEILEMIKHNQIKAEEGMKLIKQMRGPGEKDGGKPTTKHELMFYQPHWQETGPDTESHQANASRLESGRIWVFAASKDMCRSMQEALYAAKENIVLVKPGSDYHKTDKHTYEITPTAREHYTRLISDLWSRQGPPGKIFILHMWCAGFFPGVETGLDQQLARGIYSLFYLSQALMEKKPKNHIHLLVVYPKTGDEPQPQYAALSGFIETLHQENPQFVGRTVGIPSQSPGSLFELLRAELQASETGADKVVDLSYGEEGKSRWVRRSREFVTAGKTGETTSLPLKAKGVYLITGGMGGLGFIFARYLAQTLNASLVLNGRSPLNLEKQKKIDQLKHAGAEVIYVRADVSNRQEAEELAARAKARFGQINGVIHAAGVTRDAFILEKTKQEISAVLAPKVYGSVYLDHITSEENLDFFVMFSSLSSLLGNPGQADYAYANGFMDGFARWRERQCGQGKRRGITLAINWPYWLQGGMWMSEETRAAVSERTGLEAMPTNVGVQALEIALRNHQPHQSQCIVLYGHRPAVQRFFVRGFTTLIPGTSPSRTVDPEVLQEKTQRFLKQVFSQLLKLPAAQINTGVSFREYGIDSIMVNSFNSTVEKKWGAIPKTLLFEYRTLKELTRYFVENHSHRLVRFFDLQEKPPHPVPQKEPLISPRVMEHPIWVKEEKHRDIAVIGLAGRYPSARNIHEFWENLKSGKDCITEIPIERWDYRKYYDPDPEKRKMYCKWGGFLEDVDRFDPLLFNISPGEAEIMDPQERLLLETVWETLENAGYSREHLQAYIQEENSVGSGVGVFLGVTTYTYHLLGPDANYQMAVPIPCSIANRVSYIFNFHGPSMPVDTACSSSLTAVHLACESLKNGECQLAIAGGVNLYLHPYKYLGMCGIGVLSRGGKCHTFGAKADGFVPGEGVGAVLLKPLDHALRDRDHIYGVIKGTAVNHGGRTNGYTVPNPNAQAQLISRTIKNAAVNPRTISYIEAHGTGTSLGDPIEMQGLMKAYGKYTREKQFCAIGSVKTNVGHLESAAGIAGLTKILLQMQHRQLVPTLHAEVLNPNIDFENSIFYVQHELSRWESPVIKENGVEKAYPHRAGISSFGAGGANAHVILEEAPQQVIGETRKQDRSDHMDSLPGQSPRLIILSARDEERLQLYAGEMAAFLARQQNTEQPGISLVDMAYTLQVGREPLDRRIAFIAVDITEAREKFCQYSQGDQDIERFYQGDTRSGKEKISGLVEGTEGLAFIKQIISSGKMNKLGRLWVSGASIDWRLLYPHQLPRRLSLPTYPFARERCWIPDLPKKFETTEADIFTGEPGKGIFPDEVHMERDQGIPGEAQPPLTRYYRPVWEKSGQISGREDLSGSEPLLIFFHEEGLCRALKQRMKKKREIILVKPGSGFYYDAGKGIYQINPRESDDYHQLVKALVEQEHPHFPCRVVHLWSWPWSEVSGSVPGSPRGESLDTQLQYSLYSLLFLSQALMALRQRNSSSIQLLYMYPGFGVHPKTFDALYAAVSGFARSIRRENPRLVYKTLEFSSPVDYSDAEVMTWLAHVICSEFAVESQEIEVRYDIQGESNARYVKRFLPYEPTTTRENAQPVGLLEKGVYLITGGTGGLGMIFARYLAQRFKARLVLTGRSGLDPGKEAGIKELQSLGAEVIYIKSDISREPQVKDLVMQIKQKFRRLNGIIHSAGVIRDSFVVNKTPGDLAAVLAPKVWGTLYLDELTREEPLDFFVMFSSLSSVAGNIGQCDYAFANAFMDGFALVRTAQKRCGKTLSINWPFWEEGGMKMPEEYCRQMVEQIGLALFPTDEGIRAWETALHQKESQFIVVYGREEVFPYLESAATGSDINGTVRAGPTPSTIDKEQLTQQTTAFLRGVFQELFKLPAHKIDPAANFKAYGIDSILVSRFNVRMARDFRNLSRTLLYECQTLQDTVHYLLKHHEAELVQILGIREKERITTQKEAEIHKATLLQVPEKNKQKILRGVRRRHEEIAIIGISGRYPQARHLDQFWENLKCGRDCITRVPGKRWDSRQYDDPDPGKAEEGKIYCNWGGFLEDVECFDSLFFNISPRDAEIIDPQERLFLETAWAVLENAGYTRTGLAQHENKWADVGVFVGATTFSYLLVGAEQWKWGQRAILNSSPWCIANRVSYVLNVHGPSMPVDTACSSSLTAIHLACESLKKRECNLAIAGGVNLYLHPAKYISLSRMRMLSPTGRCHTFGDQGDGFVPGEGVGAVLLKPLADAVRDKDHIYAVIKSSSVNHGGATSGFTVPNPNAQARLIWDVLKKGNIDARTISCIEAHGTGTILGDPVEITGLTKTFRKYTRDNQFCSISSVKSNIGHLESAAGIAGLTKVVLQLKHGQLVPSLHCSRLNPNIDFENSPFYVQRELAEWKQQYPRRAGISSFGAGGANAHIILEEYQPSGPQSPVHVYVKEPGPYLVVLSARNRERLGAYVESMINFLEKHPGSGKKKESLPGADANELLREVQTDIVKIAAGITHVDHGDIYLDEDMKEYGIDAVKLAALMAAIDRTYNIGLIPGTLPVVTSLGALSRYLVQEYPRLFMEYYRVRIKGAGNRGFEPAGTGIDEHSCALTLADIAYTLQVGRESLEQRLAVVVSSLEELKEKFEQYSRGETCIENLYQGNAREEKEKIEFLTDEEEGDALVTSLIDSRKLHKLARLWITGIDITWARLYRDNKDPPRRVSLPTYPFEKRRHWVRESRPGTVPTDSDHRGIKLHPLIHINTSTLEEQEYTSRFMGSEFFLEDHVVVGKKTLPGVAYIEMARAAGQLATGQEVGKIKHVIWANPVVLEDKALDVHIGLYPTARADIVDFEVSSRTPGVEAEQGVVHARGKLIYENAPGDRTRRDGEPVTEIDERIDLEAVKARCRARGDGEAYYSLFREIGLAYGVSFRPIKELCRSDNGAEALSLLELPRERQGELAEFLLHPSLMDGALQTVIGLMDNNREKAAASGLYIPFALEEVEVLRPLAEQCYAYIVPVESYDRETAVKKFDILLVDGQGRVLVKMKNFSTRMLSRQVPMTQLHREQFEPGVDDILYFTGAWGESPRPVSARGHAGHGESHEESQQPLLLLHHSEEIWHVFKQRRNRVILVKPGKRFRDMGSNIYEINPGEKEDYRRLVGFLQQNDLLPHHILHLWSWSLPGAKADEADGVDEREEVSHSEAALNAQLERGVYSLFYLSQALMEQKSGDKWQLLYGYPVFGQEVLPANAAVGGFVRTVRLENPAYLSKTVEIRLNNDIDPEDPISWGKWADRLLGEFPGTADGAVNADQASNEVEIRYESENRWVRRFKELHLPGNCPGPLPLKERGVYLVTGGLGGLAMIFARFLVQQVKARLVLTDVVELQDEKQEKLKVLEHLGAEVIYVKADISRASEVEAVVREAKNRFRFINGVIHTAGVIRDAYLVKKTREEMQAVLAPKVYGTVWLDRVLRDEPLEVFVLFSSTAGCTGNPGQADYAFANRFMDCFAGIREGKSTRGQRQGKTLSIHWPLWKSGGMKVDDQVRQWMKKKAGLVPLETADGLAAFANLLKLEETQAAVMAGHTGQLRRMLGISPPGKEQGRQPSGKSLHPEKVTASPETLQEKVERDLARLCVELLKVEERDLNPEEELASYGLDSIVMMTMLSRLETMYHQVVDPNVLVEYNSIRKLADYLIRQGIVMAGTAAAASPRHREQEPASSHEEVDVQVHGQVRKVKGRFRVNPISGRTDREIKESTRQKIAVIGMACRFPRSRTPGLFWENLKRGMNLIREVPEERWSIAEYYSPDKNAENKTYSKWAALVDDIYLFDAGYFGISEEDALVMDPHHRILLELAEELFCRAGYTHEAVNNTRTGIYIGGGESGYGKSNIDKVPAGYMKHLVVNNSPNMMAARVSDFYNLKGPSQTIDTACSSALVALHQACRSIESGDCDMAVVGGIELIIDANIHIGFSKAEVLSDDGIAYVFDERAKGFALGEGAGLVLLKPYTAALQEGDEILGVILGSAVNNDGHTMGLTVPNLEGQKEVIGMALQNSGVFADSINYLEAHGTGTLLGDPMEIKAATQVYREFTREKQYCGVGSVKSNLGHLLRAAGMPSFIKVILALQNKIIPPTLHCTRPHPRFKFADSPFYPVTGLKEWQPRKNYGIRRAAVSSFGFGGTNCHMILEEFIREGSYVKKKNPLPLTQFKRKYYCLGKEIRRETEPSHTGNVDEAFLMELLENIRAGNISPQEAVHLV